MIEMLIGLAGFAILTLVAVSLVHGGDKAIQHHIDHRDLEKYEINTEGPLITAANVAEVVNSTIETGVEHPLLTETKRRAEMSRTKKYKARARLDATAENWPETQECDFCGSSMHLVSIEVGYSCSNDHCPMHVSSVGA